MNRYETIFISDPDISEEIRKQLFKKTTDLIEKQNGFICLFDEWGNKKLAYQIKKKDRGHYVRIDYCGDGALVNEMERSFRIDDKVLKFMTIVLDKNIDLELLKEELEKERAEGEETAEPETKTTEQVTEPTEEAAKETVEETAKETAKEPDEEAAKETAEEAAETPDTETEAAGEKTEAAEPAESPAEPKA